MRLSAIVITRNEESRIAACLESLAFADEKIIVDSGSSDKTRAIASAMGARVFERQFKDFSDQKNFAACQARGEWILSLDADETISPTLQDSVRNVVRADVKEAAFRIRRESWIFGRRFRASGTQFDAPVRLWRNGRARFVQAIHEEVRVDGLVGRIAEPIHHRTFSTVAEYVRRLNQYTSLEVRQYGGRPLGPPLAWGLRACGRFVRCFVLWGGYRDGSRGFWYAFLSGWYEWVKFAKIWESQKCP